MAEQKRQAKRTKEERAAEIDRTIEFHQQAIEKLKAKRAALFAPKITYKDVLTGAKEKGLTPERVAELLGISVKK